MKKISLLMSLVLLSGCVSTKLDPPSFPNGIEDRCQRQFDRAKDAIEACGTPLKYKSNLTIIRHKGQRYMNGMWVWEMSPGYWIGGITHYSKLIEIGCNPNNINDVNDGVIYHECGHYWLISNKSIGTHDPKYDPAFHWSQLDRSMVTNEASTNMFIITNGVSTNGVSIRVSTNILVRY